jgi:hypothetical protein
MTPRLLQPLRDRETRRSTRRGHDGRSQHQPRAGADAPRTAAPAERQQPGAACDPLAERVRAAGGPVDTALYTCGCGYLFSAEVSTSVSCPHCGTGQAW